jgi:alanine racemase
VPTAKKGDSVVLVGRSGQQEITVEDWARLKGTHPYDIICSLGARVQREWKE